MNSPIQPIPTGPVPTDTGATREIPTRAECEAILVDQAVSASVVHHSRKVAEVAVEIASMLLRNGVELNLELVLAGALLHDLAKGQPNHAAAGAAALRAMNLPRVASVVRSHTDFDFVSNRLDENAIVFLADKLVRGDEVVSIEQRFQPALTRFRDDPIALESVQRRMATAQAVAQAVKQATETAK
jgi:putative nucleotidyltransferase with HDIG domain